MKMILLLSFVVFAGVVFTILGASHGRQEKAPSLADAKYAGMARATFAGGCFWCTEADFEKLDGVVEVISGYTGGHVANPTYEEVSAGGTGHLEAVEVVYDPRKITYRDLVDYFWKHIDPTDAGGQFIDRGTQYGSAIFYHDQEQKKIAEESKKDLAASGRFHKPIVTAILPFTKFYPAESYHQDYYKKNPIRYDLYRFGSGRDQFLKREWGKRKTAEKPETPATRPAAHSGNDSRPSDEALPAGRENP
jgi:peptide methionine sulfoxide reductase msrA/msrB